MFAQSKACENFEAEVKKAARQVADAGKAVAAADAQIEKADTAAGIARAERAKTNGDRIAKLWRLGDWLERWERQFGEHKHRGETFFVKAKKACGNKDRYYWARDIRGPFGYATKEAARKAGEVESLRTILGRIKFVKQEAKSGTTVKVTETDALHEAGNGYHQEQNIGNATGSHPLQSTIAAHHQRSTQLLAALPELDDDLTDFLERIEDGKLSISDAHALLRRCPEDLPKHLQVRTGEGKRKNDYYTPAYALEPLLPFLPKDKTIWEPAWGKGHLASHLANAGYTVVGSEKMNFMTDIPPTHWDIAVTNIPFNDEDSKKHDFLARAYSLEKPFAFLMPGDALFGIKRVALYRQHGIQLIIPDKRINFFNDRISANNSSAWFPTAWFCWRLSVPERLNFFEARW